MIEERKAKAPLSSFKVKALETGIRTFSKKKEKHSIGKSLTEVSKTKFGYKSSLPKADSSSVLWLSMKFDGKTLSLGGSPEKEYIYK